MSAGILKEAMFYQKEGSRTLCLLCPHKCSLGEGQTGICRTRTNIDGILVTEAYGNPCAAHIDPVEKKPLYHYYPGSSIFSISTAGCNLRCLNCQNWSLSQCRPSETKNYSLMPEEVVAYCIKEECNMIAFTYGEPVAYYEYTYETAKLAKEAGLKTVLVSAGYINEAPLRLLSQYTDAANIDLKGFNPATYKALNGCSLKTVLNTLKILHEENVWIEITCLIVPSFSDNEDEFREMCQWLVKNGLADYPLHISRFSPMHRLRDLAATSVGLLERLQETAFTEGIQYAYIGNVPGHKHENTFCPSCGKEIIRRTHYMVSNSGIKDNSCSACGYKISGILTSL